MQWSRALTFDRACQVNKLKGFVKQQKKRTVASTAKTDWQLVQQQLQEER